MMINIYLSSKGSAVEASVLVAAAESALRSAKLKADVNVITSITAIEERGIHSLPAVEVDGRLVIQGRLARTPEIAQVFPNRTCGIRPIP